MPITCNIGKMPGILNPVALEDNATVQDAIDTAHLEISANSEIRQNSVLVESPTQTLAINGGTILIAEVRQKSN
jgi:hypothetical protein